MKLVVKVFNGEDHTIEVGAGATLGELKQALFNLLQVADKTARILFQGQELKEDSQALADGGVVEGAMLVAMIKKASVALSSGPSNQQEGRGDKAASDSPGGAATLTQTRARQPASTRLEKRGSAHGLLLEVR